MINKLKNPRRFKFVLVNETKFRLINANHYNDIETALNKLNHLIYEDYENSFVNLENFKFNKTFKEIFPDKTKFIKPPHAHFQQEYNKHFRQII